MSSNHQHPGNGRSTKTRPIASEAELFADWLKDAILSADAKGNVGSAAVAELAHIKAATTATQRTEVMSRPSRFLGAFEDFPAHSQLAIIHAIKSADQRESVAFELGPWYQWTTGKLLHLHKIFDRPDHAAWAKPLHRISGILAFGWRSGAILLAKWFSRKRRFLRCRISGEWTLDDLLQRMGLNAQDFVVDFAVEIEQPMAFRGIWHDDRHNNSIGLLIGLDLIPTKDGFLLIECNVGAGLGAARSDMYSVDPLVVNVAEFAAQSRYAELIVMNSESLGIDQKMRARYEEESAKRGLSLKLYDALHTPGSPLDTTAHVPEFKFDNSLIVRICYRPTALDRLIDNKSAMLHSLRHYASTVGETDFLIPEVSLDDDQLIRMTQPNFPNLVYKISDLDAGTGVIFLKAQSLDHARELIREELAHPSSAKIKERLLRRASSGHGDLQLFSPSLTKMGGRQHKIRSHVLVTPRGTCFLSAHNFIAKCPAPESAIPFGLVRDVHPFLVNNASGGVRQAVAESDLAPIAKASVDVARGILWSVQRCFRTSP